MFQIMVEQFEFELLRCSFFKPHWDLKVDWFKTYATSVNLTLSEVEQILPKLSAVIEQEEKKWGSDNLKVISLKQSEPELRKKLLALLEG